MRVRKMELSLHRISETNADVTPINLESLPLKELCIAEVLYEEVEKAKSDGREGPITITLEQVNAKFKEKMREKKKTGKVSTSVPAGVFGMTDAPEQS